jgi:phosphoribosylformylglycinamidine synthase
MAASAIDEALRNAVAVGGDLATTAILDNFSWGNPNIPDRLGALVRAVRACYEVATGYGVPFISGKDSLNNEYRDTVTGETISIPPTLLISAMSVIPDVSRVVSMDLKEAGDLIYMLGETSAELGGSHYYLVRGYTGGSVPKVDPARGRRLMEALHGAISQGLVRACHDCSEGGIGVAAAEMAFAGDLGMRLDLREVPASDVERSDALLFSESNSRFLVEVALGDRVAFEEIMAGNAFATIGKVMEARSVEIKGLDGRTVVSAELGELKRVWQQALGGEGG